MTREYLPLASAATILDVAPRTLAKWAREGRIPAYKTPGGQWRFARDDLILALAPGGGRGRGEGGAEQRGVQ